MLSGHATLEARCRVGASQTSVLVTEWSAAEKANLEGLLQGGAVGVAFSGCSMRVIPQCRLAGRYLWQRTTPSTETLEINSEAELFARLPLGAISLSGELNRSGSLAITTTVSGQRRLDGVTGADVPNQPACEEVTHVVSALTLGAFTLTAGESLRGGVGVSALSLPEVRGSASVRDHIVRTAGIATNCASASAETPGVDCSSPIQVFLSPVPGRSPPPGPPGTVAVDFESASEDVRWDLYVDDQATCTTPCSRWVDPTRPVVMRTRDFYPSSLRIGQLDHDAGPLQVTAAPTSMGELLTGLTFTTLGGLALISGISLTGVGCSSDRRESLCTPGLITMGVGAAVTVGSILLMLDARSRFTVRPIFGTDLERQWRAGLEASLIAF